MDFIGTALINLAPKAQWSLTGDNLDDLQWMSTDIQRPSNQAIEAECERLRLEYENNQYQRDRALKYPKIAEQLDMLYHDIKNGTLNSGAWIQAIEAVKTEYPKP